MITKIYAVPEIKINLFEKLYHWTSIKSAISILESENIYSNKDVGRHANFHIKDKIEDYETNAQIRLIFKFKGIHKLAFGNTFDQPLPPPEFENSIFHLITSDEVKYDPNNISTFSTLNHWQSVVYPNTRGLIFQGVDWNPSPTVVRNKDWYLNPIYNLDTEPKKPSILNRKAHKQYKIDIEIYRLREKIMLLESNAKDKEFTVIPPNSNEL